MHGPDIPVSWSKLAHYYDRSLHDQGNIDALTGRELNDPIEDNPLWDIPPEEGSLPAEEAWQLIDTLAAETAKPLECFFGVREGFAYLDDLRKRTSARIHLPMGRNHVALRGPVYLAARSLCTDVRQTVNLWWNAERSWCVATDIGHDSTFVGGSRDCIRKILDNPALETVEVTPGAPLG
ncbi:hypothetical protein [Halosaccharopolyspora lacisalsi]|nr:hypothetical protein [Halosaccharopolyspora lacisalsi]